jgi:hypothetical protein
MRIFLCLLGLLIALALNAQQYPQAYGFGTSGEEYGLRIAVDEEGNVYTAGGYESTIDFGNGKTLSANGSPAVGLYIAKHNAQGEVQWVVNGGTDHEELFYLGLDTSGNVYVSGSFLGTQTYGPNTFTTMPNESNDNFIMKIQSDGVVAWSRHIRGPDHEHIQGMSVAENGDIYVSGFFDATFTFEGTTFVNKGNSDIFVMKFDTDNNFIWGIANGSTGLDWPWDVAIDNKGNLYLTGQFSTSFNWDTEAVSHIDGEDILVVKMSAADGSVIYAKSYGGTSADQGKGIATDQQGNVFVSGFFSDALSFGATQLLTSGSTDGFVFKLDENGNYLWGNAFGGNVTDSWIVPPVVDQYGNVYVGGSLNRDVVAGGITFTNTGSRDAFVGKYLSDGSFERGLMIGGTRLDQLGGMAVNEAGKMWVTGRYTSASFTLGTHTLTNAGSNSPDVFMVEVGEFATGLAPTTVNDLGVWLFPNPAEGYITIKHPAQFTGSVAIVDCLGRVIRELEVLENEQTLPIAYLKPGTYYLKVEQNEGAIGYYRFIKSAR